MRYANVKWFINNKCNLSCPFCFVKEMKNGEQSFEDKCKVLDKLHSEGVKYIDFFGKEPLFDSTIFELMKYGESKNYDFIYSFISNGKNLKKYTKELIKSPCRSFAISYDFKSGDRSFQFDLNDLLPFKNLGFFIELSIDVHSGNISKILSEINEPLKYGVNSLYFNPIIPWGNDSLQGSFIVEEDFSKFISSAANAMSAEYDSILVKVPHIFKNLTKAGYGCEIFVTEPICTAGKTHFCIDSEGTAFGCEGQCATNSTKNTCSYLDTPEEELYKILSNHKNRERMCGGYVYEAIKEI